MNPEELLVEIVENHESLEYFEKNFKAIKKAMNDFSDSMYIECLYYVRDYLIYKEMWKDYQKLLSKGISIADKKNDYSKGAIFYNDLAAITESLKTAEKYYLKSIELYQKAGDSVESCLAQLDLAYTYGENQSYDKAFSCYDDVYEKSLLLKNSEITINTLISRATLHREKGFEDKEALECYEESLKISSQLDDEELVYDILYNIALTTFSLSLWERNAEVNLLLFDIMEKNEMADEMIVTALDIHRVFSKLDRLDDAKPFIKKAYESLESAQEIDEEFKKGIENLYKALIKP